MIIIVFIIAMFLLTISFVIAMSLISSSHNQSKTFITVLSKGAVRASEKMLDSDSKLERERKELYKKSSMF